jgi:DNA-binding CsgD family transcriptional regulator
MRLVIDPLSPHDQKRITVLTPREREVLEMTARGLSNRQMAERLEVSIHAVKFHLAMIYRKLQVANRTEASFVYLNAPRPGEPLQHLEGS